MSKNDASKAQNAIDYQGGMAQNNLDTIRTSGNQQHSDMWNDYRNSLNSQKDDYGNIMGLGGGYASGGNDFSFDPRFRSQLDNAIAGYESFARDGGFSDQNLSDIRARAIAPTRAVYANAQTNIDRQRALQGGYSPNYTAATTRMAKDLAAGLSDANTNAEAEIAQMVQAGKLAGLGGVSQSTLSGQGMQNQINATNAQQRLGGLNSMSGMYSASPGQSEMFARMFSQSGDRQLTGQQLQQALGLGIIDAQIKKSTVPSNYKQGVDNYRNTVGAVGDTMSLAYGGAGR